LASCRTKAATIERARELIAAAAPPTPPQTKQQAVTDDAAATAAESESPEHACPSCGGRMLIIETFEAGRTPRHRPTAPPTAIRIDTSWRRSRLSRLPLTPHCAAGSLPATTALGRRHPQRRTCDPECSIELPLPGRSGHRLPC
jgi:hypothetical protein